MVNIPDNWGSFSTLWQWTWLVKRQACICMYMYINHLPSALLGEQDLSHTLNRKEYILWMHGHSSYTKKGRSQGAHPNHILLEVDEFEKSTWYGLICLFIKTVALGMIGWADPVLNASHCEEGVVQLIDRFLPLIGVAIFKASQSTNETKNKLYHWLSWFVGETLSLYPLGKIICTGNYIPVALSSCSERTN